MTSPDPMNACMCGTAAPAWSPENTWKRTGPTRLLPIPTGTINLDFGLCQYLAQGS